MALSKIFITQFYARNTGFFLAVFYFFFGIVPGGQLISYHTTLITAFTSNIAMLLLVLLLWLLYTLKCVGYVHKTLSAKENIFLYGTLGILEDGPKRRTLLRIQLSLYSPVLLYSIPAILIAFKDSHYIAAASILLFNILMIILAVWSYERKIKHPGTTSLFSTWQDWLNRLVRKPLWTFYIYELLNGNVKSLAITKFIGAVILLFTCTFIGEEYDKRVVLVGLLVNLLMHSILVFNHRRFDDLYLSTIPHLPILLWKRYVQTVATYFVLLLPEYILLLLKTNVVDLPLFLMEGTSVLILLRSLLYFPQLDQDKYYRWVFLIIVGVLFLNLAYLYWFAVVLLQLIAFGIFYYRYYRYEPPLQEIQ